MARLKQLQLPVILDPSHALAGQGVLDRSRLRRDRGGRAAHRDASLLRRHSPTQRSSSTSRSSERCMTPSARSPRLSDHNDETGTDPARSTRWAARGADATKPRWRVPVRHVSILGVVLRGPAQLRFDLLGIDGVATIMPRTVRHKRTQACRECPGAASPGRVGDLVVPTHV